MKYYSVKVRAYPSPATPNLIPYAITYYPLQRVDVRQHQAHSSSCFFLVPNHPFSFSTINLLLLVGLLCLGFGRFRSRQLVSTLSGLAERCRLNRPWRQSQPQPPGRLSSLSQPSLLLALGECLLTAQLFGVLPVSASSGSSGSSLMVATRGSGESLRYRMKLYPSSSS